MSKRLEKKDSLHGGAVIATLALSNFAIPFMISGVAVTLPTMGRELSMSGASLGLFETLYLGVSAAFLLPAGRLGDAGEKRFFFLAGMVLFTLVTFGLGFAPSAPLALALRALQGFSAAFITATNMALLSECVPRAKVGRAIGLNIAAIYVGLSAGPFFAGLLTTTLSWRWMYMISGLFVLGGTLVAAYTLRPKWRHLELDFDWLGMITSALGMLALVSGSALVERTPLGWGIVGLGVLLVVVFFVVEKRSPSPLLPIKALVEMVTFRRAILLQLLTYSGAFGTSFLFALYLQEAFGWSAAEAGRLLILSPIVMATLAPVAGKLSDTMVPQKIVAFGVTLACLGTFIALLVPRTGSIPLLVVAIVAQGLGFAFFSSPNMKVVLTSVSKERTGMATALASQMRTLGMVSSMMLITVFLALHLGEEGLKSKDALAGLSSTIERALLIIGGVAFTALVIAWRDARAGGRREKGGVGE